MPAASRPARRTVGGRPPVIEVMGPWLNNKGDQLMLHAVAQRLQERALLAVSTTLGLDRLPSEPSLQRLLQRPTSSELVAAVRSASPRRSASAIFRRAALPLAPQRWVQHFGRVDAARLTGLVDCSGFAYGDPWSTGRLRRRARYYAELRRRGVRHVLLPQALGPFEDPEVRDLSRQLLDCFDLICPRDDESRHHVESLGIPSERLFQAPDITHLVAAPPPHDHDEWRDRVCIVPSARMLDRTGDAVSGGYVDYLVDVVHQVRQTTRLTPWLVLHEKNDTDLLKQVQARLPAPAPVLDESGLHTKGVLGACHAVVGSRYHALVSALSQGTPTLGMSWSHKYEALFDEYDARDFLVTPRAGSEEARHRLTELLDPGSGAALRERLALRAEQQAEQVRLMWQRAEEVLLR